MMRGKQTGLLLAVSLVSAVAGDGAYWWMNSNAFGGNNNNVDNQQQQGNQQQNGNYQQQPSNNQNHQQPSNSNNNNNYGQQQPGNNFQGNQNNQNNFQGAQGSLACAPDLSCLPLSQCWAPVQGGLSPRLVNANFVECGNSNVCCSPQRQTQPETFTEALTTEVSAALSLSNDLNDLTEEIAPSALPQVECPYGMRCVSENYCNSAGQISLQYIQLTPQQIKKNKKNLIPCMNLETATLAVCCNVPKAAHLTKPTANDDASRSPAATGSNQGADDVLVGNVLPATQGLVNSPNQGSCPAVTNIPPPQQCTGRPSNCWSVGQADVDCIGNALCCFDGCANVCQGAGPIAGNPQPQQNARGQQRPSNNNNKQQTQPANNQQQNPANNNNNRQQQPANNTNRQQAQPANNNNNQQAQPANNNIRQQQPANNNNGGCGYGGGCGNQEPNNNQAGGEGGGLLFPPPAAAGSNNQGSISPVNPPAPARQPVQQQQPRPQQQQQPRPQQPRPVQARPVKQQPRPVQQQPRPVQQQQPRQPQQQQNSGPAAATKPYVSCPSAMKCVPKENCDFNGVMVNEVIVRTPQLEGLGVPLIPCVNRAAGNVIDVCCRDPNYKDPWPNMNGNMNGNMKNNANNFQGAGNNNNFQGNNNNVQQPNNNVQQPNNNHNQRNKKKKGYGRR